MPHQIVRFVTAILVAVLCAPSASAFARRATQSRPRGDAPHFIYSTLLGGAAGNFDGASDIAVDSGGNAIVVGATESSDFPTSNPLQDSLEGGSDGFIAKFDVNGALVFSTFFGGDEHDSVDAVSVDSTGAIYVAGSTNSADFPVSAGFQMTKGVLTDAFVAKIAADGSSIVWASFLGGSGSDTVSDLAVDSAGRVYVTGEVEPLTGDSATFPTANAFQQEYGGGGSDGFVSVVAQSGNALLASSLLDAGMQGGAERFGRERISSILVDSDTGKVFMAGNVEFDENEPESPFACVLELPPGTLAAARDPQVFVLLLLLLYNWQPDFFFSGAKFFIDFLIGTSRSLDSGRGAGSPRVISVITGYCPVPPPDGPCERPATLVTTDARLALRAEANLPLLDEFFFEVGTLDRQDAIYIAGDISSDRLTTVNPLQSEFGGNSDVVIAVLEPGTLARAMVTFFGGDGYDLPTSMATDAEGNVFVCGVTTLSTQFPTSAGALQAAPLGRNDAFLVKIAPLGPFPEAPDFSLSFAEPVLHVMRGSKVTVPLTVSRVAGFDGNVTVAPPPQTAGFKSLKKAKSVSGSTLTLKFKIKADAPAGPTTFTLTGTDRDGRSRSATITLDVQ